MIHSHCSLLRCNLQTVTALQSNSPVAQHLLSIPVHGPGPVYDADRGACSGRRNGHGNVIASLQRIPRPACAGQNARAVHLHAPADNISVFVGHVEQDRGVRIPPHESRDDAFENHGFAGVVRHAGSVVRQQRRWGQDDESKRNDTAIWFFITTSPSKRCSGSCFRPPLEDSNPYPGGI